MPWEKFKGEELEFIPASDLFWMEDQIKYNLGKNNDEENRLLNYVDENLGQLMKEMRMNNR